MHGSILSGPQQAVKMDGARRLPLPGESRVSQTILLVEDEPAVKGLFSQALHREGYTVHEARNGVEALEVAKGIEHIDVLVTDIGMPAEDGYSLVRKLRALPIRENIVAIASALDARDLRRRTSQDATYFDIASAWALSSDSFTRPMKGTMC